MQTEPSPWVFQLISAKPKGFELCIGLFSGGSLNSHHVKKDGLNKEAT
jgi:hypothetical protein